MSSLTRRAASGSGTGAVPPRILNSGGHTARVRPWPGDPYVAQLHHLEQHAAPHVAVLRSWIGQLERLGYHRVRTGAVSTLRTAPYDALGFAPIQQLSLLHADLAQRRERLLGTTKLRSARAGELGELARLDRRAFPEGWGLDEVAIGEAASATARHRVRVAAHGLPSGSRGPLGYAVTGRSGRLAFLQRLAVDPTVQGQGIGATLVLDALGWARRWRCTTMAVNTQTDNDPALSLYRRAGFQARSHGLVVLERDLRIPV